MVAQHYRWDFVGLSTDTKPTPETSEKVVNGSTFYCSDTSKLYVFCKNNWYERKPLGGGGGTTYTAGEGINISDNTISVDTTTIQPKLTIAQTTGTSETDVMSQNATTSMVFADPSTGTQIRIGSGSSVGSFRNVSIGQNATASDTNTLAVGSYAWTNAANATAVGDGTIVGGIGSTAIGYLANTGSNQYSVALGTRSTTSRDGEVNVGATQKHGFNNTNYRVIGGVHDGQGLHDCATVAQGNTLATTAPTTSTVGVLGQLYTDTTTMHTYQCTAISGDTYTWTQRW